MPARLANSAAILVSEVPGVAGEFGGAALTHIEQEVASRATVVLGPRECREHEQTVGRQLRELAVAIRRFDCGSRVVEQKLSSALRAGSRFSKCHPEYRSTISVNNAAAAGRP